MFFDVVRRNYEAITIKQYKHSRGAGIDFWRETQTNWDTSGTNFDVRRVPCPKSCLAIDASLFAV